MHSPRASVKINIYKQPSHTEFGKALMTKVIIFAH